MIQFQTIGERSEQQDAAAWEERDGGVIAVVCDGHGVHGAIASATAVEIIMDSLKEHDEIDAEMLLDVFRDAHEDLAMRTPHSGATATVVVRKETRLLIAYVGDSEARAVRRDGSLHTLTIPHRLKTHSNEYARLERMGAATSGEYVLNDEKEGLQMTRALGDSEFDPFVLHEPEIVEYDFSDDRFLLIGSDGFWDPLSRRSSRRSKFGELLSTATSEQDAIERTKEFLTPLSLFDNVTVLVKALK